MSSLDPRHKIETAAASAAFAAQQAIITGAWDEHLHTIAESITKRQRTDEYRTKILARAEFRAGRS